MTKTLNLFFVFLFCFGSIIEAQINDDNFVFISKETETKRAISSIVQDHKGFIWMGTNGAGLYKYDSFEYTSYLKKQGNISKNNIKRNSLR